MPQPPQTGEKPSGEDTASSAPKKKAARRRRKKKPATEAPAEQEKAGSPRPATDDRRWTRKKVPSQEPRTGRPALAVPAVPVPGPVRGRRTGLGAGGKPRRGRTAASLITPTPPAPGGPRKPVQPRPDRLAPGETRPQESEPSTKAKLAADQTVAPDVKRQEDERAERKRPVSKTRQPSSVETGRDDREREPVLAEPPRSRPERAEQK